MTHAAIVPLARRAHYAAVASLLAMLAGGCVHDQQPRLPTFPAADAPAILETIRDRTASIETLTGKGSIALDSPTRGQVTLESAFALRPPGDARVRAWKFNQAVFDLTVLTDGDVWLYAPRERNGQGELSAGGAQLGASIRSWTTLFLSGPEQDDSTTASTSGERLTLTSADPSGAKRITEIDRPTRTLRSQRLIDANGTERFRLSFDSYRLFGDVLWPARITAVSETGTIVVRTDALTTNDAPSTAFKPSPRASKLP